MQKKREKVTKSEVLSAIPNSHGQLVRIEERLNCTRQAIRDAMCPEIARELHDEIERDKDRIFIHLTEDALAGNNKALELYLKTMKDRGFGDKIELTTSDNKPLIQMNGQFLNITANPSNGNMNKNARVEAWEADALEYHEKQIECGQGRSIEEVAGSIIANG